MTISMYALVKNSKVENILAFEEPTEQLLEDFRILHNCEHIIEVPHKFGPEGPYALTAECTWDGEDFILPKPFPSFVLDENKDWVPPVPFPSDDKMYNWDEESVSWVIVEL